MKKSRLFWHLIRFHLQLAPWWMLPLLVFIIGLPLSLLGMNSFTGDNIFRNDYRSHDQLMPFIYFFILAAQLTWGIRWGRNMAQNQPWTTGSYTFLFTRAIDRPTLYWAKLTVFLAICLLPFVPTLGRTLNNPDIRIQLQSSLQNEKTLAFQKSFPDLKIQEGNPKTKEAIITLSGAGWNWCFFKFSQILLIGLTVVWLCALSWRWPKIWILALTLFLFAAFTPALLALSQPRTPVPNLLSDDETILIWTQGHQGLMLATLAVFAALALWDSHRRFLKLPQYKGAML